MRILMTALLILSLTLPAAAQLKEAEQAFEKHNYAEALELYRKAYDKSPSPELRVQILRTLLKLRRWDELVSQLDQALNQLKEPLWRARLLHLAAQIYQQIPHQGYRFEGRLSRSEEHREGDYVWLASEDQALSQKYFSEARKLYEQLSAQAKPERLREVLVFNTDLSNFWLEQLWIPYETKDWPKLAPAESYPFAWQDQALALSKVWQLYQENVWIARQLKETHQEVLERYRWAQILFNHRGLSAEAYPDQDPLQILQALAKEFPADRLIPEIRLLTGDVYNERAQYTSALESYQMLLGTKLKEHAESRIQELTWPRLNLSSRGAQPPNTAAEFSIQGRNLEPVRFELYSVPLERILQDPANLYAKSGRSFHDYVQNLGGSFKGFREVTQKLQEWTWTPSPAKPYAPFSQSLKLPKAMPAGAYLLEAHTGKVRTALLMILSDVVLTSRRDQQRTIYFLADAVSGRPIPNANLYIKETRGYQPNQQVRAYREKTDDQGMYNFYQQTTPSPESRQFEAFAAWNNHYALSNMGYWSPYANEAQSWRVYSYTDRPLYRPGQQIHFRQLLRLYQQGKYLPSKQALEVSVRSPQGEEIYKQVLSPNQFGSLHGSLTLPENAALGRYQISFRVPESNLSLYPSGSSSFQVEEYKKPEYSVEIKPQPTLPGEQAKARIEASYLFGGAVAGAKVQYTVTRRNYWPYWGDDFDYWERPQRDRSEQTVLQQSATLDAQGQLEISFATQADQDSVYTIEAQVTDASRREVTQAQTLTVTRQAFFAQLKLDQGFYQEGDRVSVEINLKDANGQAVPKQAGTVIVERIKSQDRDKIEVEKVYSQPVSSDAAGRIFVRWNSSLGGKYRLRFEARDKREKQVEALQEFWVAGKNFTGQTIRLKGVELITDKRSYAPGETVEVLVQTDKPDSHVWLTQESDDAILKSDLLRLSGRSQVMRFALREQHQPNFMLRALSVSDRQLYSDERELFAPALQHRLQISLKPDQQSYQPGSKGKLQLEVRDHQNRPVQSELSLAMVDSALYQLLPDATVAIHEALYGQRRRIPQTLDHSLNLSFSDYVDYLVKQKNYNLKNPYSPLPGLNRADARMRQEAGDMPLPSPAMEADEPADRNFEKADAKLESVDDGLAAAPRVRSEFKDTAYWNPSVVTNAKGQAELSLDFPDNLTTWRLVSRGWNTTTGVGQTQTEVKTRQDLMLRLQHPRFLTEQDQVVVSANLNNELPSAQDVSVSLKVDSHLGLQSPALQKVKLPARGQIRVDWRLKVLNPGSSTLVAEARGAKASDAVQQSLPIQVYGALKTETRNGSTQNSAKVSLTLPAERKPEQTQLKLTLQPSLAATLLDALPYLAEYPYGCIEQTTSRFVPAVLVSRTLSELGVNLDQLGKQLDLSQKELRIKQPLASRAELDKMIAEGLKRIASGQSSDGGWGWWPGARESDPYMSSYVLDALLLAQEADLRLDAGMLERGLTYLSAEFKDTDSLHLKAYQAYVLARAKRLNAEALKPIFEQRDELNSYSKALLAMALHYAGQSEQAQLVLQNMKSFVRRDAASATASWDNASNWWYWYGDRIETNATILQAFTLISPQDGLVPELMRWLVYNREGNRWHSTKDTARAVYALSGYLHQSKELKADFSVSVKLNGKVLQSVKFSPEQALSGPVTIALADQALKTGENQLELTKTGSGTLYYSAALQSFSREEKIKAAGNRIEVQRSYFKVVDKLNPETQLLETSRTPLADGALLLSGEEVEVRVAIKAPNDYEYLLFEDFKPAGFEALETLSGYDYQNGTGIYREFRDNRVSMFLGWMPQGTQVLTYRLRAEVPGTFSALPHRVEAMYAPAIQATSDSARFSIQDPK